MTVGADCSWSMYVVYEDDSRMTVSIKWNYSSLTDDSVAISINARICVRVDGYESGWAPYCGSNRGNGNMRKVCQCEKN